MEPVNLCGRVSGKSAARSEDARRWRLADYESMGGMSQVEPRVLQRPEETFAAHSRNSSAVNTGLPYSCALRAFPDCVPASAVTSTSQRVFVTDCTGVKPAACRQLLHLPALHDLSRHCPAPSP